MSPYIATGRPTSTPLWRRGFHVSQESGWTGAQFENYLDSKTKDRSLHGMFFWGHGFMAQDGSAGLVTVDETVLETLIKEHVQHKCLNPLGGDAYKTWYDSWGPGFRLGLQYRPGLRILFACYSLNAKERFSADAIFWGAPGLLDPILRWNPFMSTVPSVETLVPPGAQGTRTD